MTRIIVRRAKIFLSQAEGKEQRSVVSVGGPHVVPDWVKTTSTYDLGVKDGSILEVVSPAPAVVEESETKKSKAKGLQG